MLHLLDVKCLTAPNVWGDFPVLETSFTADGAVERALCEVSDVVHTHLRNAESGTRERFPNPAKGFAELVMLLQRGAESPVSFVCVEETEFPMIWRIVLEIEEEAIGRASLEIALRMVTNALRNLPLDVEAHIDRLREIGERHRPGNTTKALADAANRRGIPVIRLDAESLVQLGHGCQQHRVRTATTDRTSFIAESISRDKLLTKDLLGRVGIPVAQGRIVRDADDACRAALEIGTPVVVKPRDADFGRGVSVNLCDPTRIRTAYSDARVYSKDVLVEKYLPGRWHRLMVVNGRVVAAVRRDPPLIHGDGKQTVAELIAAANTDPRRGVGVHFPLEPLRVTSVELAHLYRQGFSVESVPPAGREVELREDAYLLSGATQTDVTERVHPEIAEIAIHATEIIGLDVAGLDFICTDVSQPPAAQSLGVLEVNAEPAIIIHMAPYCDPPRPVAETIISSLFPGSETGRIPVIAIVGNAIVGNATLGERLAMESQRSGETVGVVTHRTASLNGRGIGRPHASVRRAMESLAMHPRTTCLVLNLTLDDIRETGFPIEHCDRLCLADWPQHFTAEQRRTWDWLANSPDLAKSVLVNGDRFRHHAERLSSNDHWIFAVTDSTKEHESNRFQESERLLKLCAGDLILAEGKHAERLDFDLGLDQSPPSMESLLLAGLLGLAGHAEDSDVLKESFEQHDIPRHSRELQLAGR